MKAPVEHLKLFEDYYREFTSWNRGPAQLAPGHLRPSLRFTLPDAIAGRPFGKPPLDVALKLLLYAHEVLLDDPLSSLEFDNRRSLRGSLEILLRLQPLAELGAVHLVQLHSRGRHPASTGGSREVGERLVTTGRPQFERLLVQATEFGITSIEEVARTVASDVFGSVGISRGWPGRVQPLVRNHAEAMILEAMFDDAARAMPDLRSIHLQKLAAMTIPSLDISVGDLVAVRRSSEDFAKWRVALASALREVQQIEESVEGWVSQAASIVHVELEAVREQVQAETQRSPALASLRSGTAGFALAGLGAVVGATVSGGNLLAPLVGAGSVKIVETTASYVRSLRKRRRGRALLDLALTFNDRTDG